MEQVGATIAKLRKKLGVTQEEFGRRYSISGPAVHKFERAMVRPSLELWLKMAHDYGMAEGDAVVVWIRSRLPLEYRQYLPEEFGGRREKTRDGEISRDVRDRKELRSEILACKGLSKEAKQFLTQEEFLGDFKPDATEINALIRLEANHGPIKGNLIADAMWIIRRFRTG